MNCLISILMPARNARGFVGAAVKSVLADHASAAARGIGLELLLVDDGSTDGTADAAVKAAVALKAERLLKVVQGPRRGISAAFNAGLEAATGTLLSRCDADDLYAKGRWSRQVGILAEDPDAVAVCGAYTRIDAKGREVFRHVVTDGATEVTEELLSGVGRTHLCTYLIRTDVVRRLGGCREWFVVGEDADIQFRIAGEGRVLYRPTVEYKYRLHDGSITHREPDSRQVYFTNEAVRLMRQRLETGIDDLQAGNPPAIPHLNGHVTRTSAQIRDILLGEAWQRHARGDRVESLRLIFRAARRRPFDVAIYRNLAAALLKSP